MKHKTRELLELTMQLLNKEGIPTLAVIGGAGDGMVAANGDRKALYEAVKNCFDCAKCGVANLGQKVVVSTILDAITVSFSPEQLSRIAAGRTDEILKL